MCDICAPGDFILSREDARRCISVCTPNTLHFIFSFRILHWRAKSPSCRSGMSSCNQSICYGLTWSDSNTIIFLKTAGCSVPGWRYCTFLWEYQADSGWKAAVQTLQTSPAHSVPLETAAASHHWEHHKTGVSSAVSKQLHQPHFTDNQLASLLQLISLWQQIRRAVRRWVHLSSNHWSSDSCSDMNWAPLTGLSSPQQQGWSWFLIIDVSQP